VKDPTQSPRLWTPDKRIHIPDPLPNVLYGGTINLLAGASGVGKTALLSGWIKALLDKAPINGYPVGEVAEVAYVSGDRGVDTAVRWFETAGIDLNRLKIYSLRDDPEFRVSRLRKRDEAAKIFIETLDILDLPPYSLPIFDPFILFAGGDILNYKECAIAVLEMGKAIQKRKLTMLGLAHASKQLADRSKRYLRPQDRIVGSTAQLGYTDTQMYLASPEEAGTEHYYLHWNPHNSRSESFQLPRLGNGLFGPGVKMADGEVSREQPVEALLEHIDEERGTLFGELAKVVEEKPEYQISSRTLRRALNDLIKAGHVIKVGHGKYKRLKPC